MKKTQLRRIVSLLLATLLLIPFMPVNARAAQTTEVSELDVIRHTDANNTVTGIKTGAFRDTSGNKYTDALQFTVAYIKKDTNKYSRMEYIDYQLGQRYSCLSGTIACGAGSEEDVIMKLEIWLDGKKAETFENITYGDVIPFQVDIEGVKVLRINCSTATDDIGHCIVSATVGDEYQEDSYENYGIPSFTPEEFSRNFNAAVKNYKLDLKADFNKSGILEVKSGNYLVANVYFYDCFLDDIQYSDIKKKDCGGISLELDENSQGVLLPFLMAADPSLNLKDVISIATIMACGDRTGYGTRFGYNGLEYQWQDQLYVYYAYT